MQSPVQLGSLKRVGDVLVQAVTSHPWCEVTYILCASDFVGCLLQAGTKPMPSGLGEAARLYAHREHDRLVTMLIEARQGAFRAERNGFVVCRMRTDTGGEILAYLTAPDDVRPLITRADGVSLDDARGIVLARWQEVNHADRLRLFRIAKPWAA
jgi:hypothetical protein